MLFVDLTVIEHLVFFGMLKGISMTEARRQASKYIYHIFNKYFSLLVLQKKILCFFLFKGK